jgi:chitodextrinase
MHRHGNTSTRSRFFAATHPCLQPIPAAPSGLRLADATETSVSVAWNASTGAVAYNVAVDGSSVGRTSSTSYRAGNLICGRAYQVAVAAMDAAGNRSASASIVASTSACPQPAPSDTQRPSTPSAVSVASTTETTVQLAWQPATDNVGVARYGVYRAGALAATTAATGHTFESLSCGSSYQLGVDAFDAAGNRSSAAQIVAATRACALDSAAPSQPGNVWQLSRTETSITIGWAESTDNVGVAGYRLFRGGASVDTTAQTLYTYSALACGSSYTLEVHAYDAAGNHSAQAVVMMTTAACPDVTPPSAPTGLSTSSVTQTSATLAWTGSPGAAGYGLYVHGASAGQTTSTSYVFAALACGKTYTLAADAYDAAGNRSGKSSVSVTTTACSAPTPTAPPPPTAPSSSGLAVSPGGNDWTCVRGDASRPCRTFQRAYDLAQPGDTVLVQPGTYPPNDAARAAVTVIGSVKATSEPVTFTCTGGTVDVAAAWFVIKAFHVRLSGSCFLLHGLRIGEGDDTGVTTNNVTVEGVKMEGVEVAGAQQVVLRNVEIGPAVYCYAQGKTGYGINGGPITPAMWCDPAGPRYESFYANRGNGDLRFESFFHNNSGGVNPTLVMEGSYVHDIQTKDAVNLHTACGLIWTVPGAPSNSLVFRGNRFENCAVQGIQVETGDGLTFENNMFGYPTEPLSNGRGDDVEAAQGQRELNLKTGNGWTPRNYLIRFNSFSHGISVDQSEVNPSYQNFKVIGNILGSYSYCEGGGAVFDQNVFVGPACGSNSVSIPSFPYVRYNAPIDYHLAATGPYVDLVSSDNGSDYVLKVDYDGEGRPMGARRDAGADEKQ